MVGGPLRTGEEPLLFLVVNDYRLQIFGFDNQTAVQAFHIIHAVTPGDNDGAAMLTIGWYELHKDELGLILSMSPRLSSAKIQCFYPRSAFGFSLGIPIDQFARPSQVRHTEVSVGCCLPPRNGWASLAA